MFTNTLESKQISEQIAEHHIAESIISKSWRRCEEIYGLSRENVDVPTVITQLELREIADPLDALIFEAKSEMRNIYMRLKEHDYLISITDSQGITLHHLVPPSLEADSRKFNIYKGALWDEDSQGTNGVGTAIATGKAVSIVREDHFAKNYAGLSCTTAPIFSCEHEIAAILNVTTPRNTTRREQAITLQIVKQAAKRIENMWFLNQYHTHSILQVSHVGSFGDIANGDLIALSPSGNIVASTIHDDSRLKIDRAKFGLGKHFYTDVLGVSDDQAIAAIRARQSIPIQGSSSKLYLHYRDGSTDITKRAQTESGSRLSEQASTSLTLNELAGQNPHLLRNTTVAKKVFEAKLPILITGETGTGKGAFAKALHQQSSRACKPFIAINCAAIPESLCESILFGYLPGAFTGADKKGSAGSLVKANGGTLFLDEIGDMPLNSQTRLLRVLSEKEVTPLGATKPISLDVNVISATLHDIETLVDKGSFREDLYYRIGSVPLKIPALRERDDKLWVIKKCFEAIRLEQHSNAVLSEQALRILKSHFWKGNFRELISVIQYALAIDNDGLIQACDLPEYLKQETERGLGNAQEFDKEDKIIIRRALNEANGNLSRCAKLMGISRSTLYRKMKKLGMDQENH